VPTLPPNPYIAEDVPRKAYGNMVLQLIKMFSMTTRLDSELTDSYMLLALQYSAALTGDRLTGFYAAVWEAAHFMNAAAGPDVVEVSYEVGEQTCGHETCKLANEAEAALIEAAIRGEGPAVQGICKAVVAESRRRTATGDENAPEPEVALFMLWAGALRRFLGVMEAPDEG
jgi:hypothetical protein